MNIRIPATAVLGALEFDKFVEINNLYDDIYSVNNYDSIRSHFLESEFDERTKRTLKEYLKKVLFAVLSSYKSLWCQVLEFLRLEPNYRNAFLVRKRLLLKPDFVV